MNRMREWCLRQPLELWLVLGGLVYLAILVLRTEISWPVG